MAQNKNQTGKTGSQNDRLRIDNDQLGENRTEPGIRSEANNKNRKLRQK